MAEQAQSSGGFWVFGYGSLMWKPGFDYLERRRARLKGYRRRFGLASIRYRGTPEFPGLVLGLDWDPDAACTGMAFRICPSRDTEVRDYLAGRELVTRSYFEVAYPIDLIDEKGAVSDRVDAICYILDRSHPQYSGDLSLAEQAAIIAAATGPMGSNREYLESTVCHLTELGLEDPELVELSLLVAGIVSAE